ncbi:MAG: putative transcriptional regulator [Parcubacteria group bacterium GW2011_GWA2_51_12]|nr:MAG: putative transcriptional regulator [Parcubacteria group bacterium GW2011_GWA2_51_12]
MLEKLLNSKIKKRLLNIFFNFPNRGFSPTELKHMTGSSVNAVATALREFVKADLLRMAARGQRRFYSLNIYYKWHDELKDLVTDEEQDLVDEVVRKLRSVPDVKVLVLSGIFSFQPQQPVDVFLVGDTVNRQRILRALDDIEEHVGEPVNYTLLGVEEYQYRKLMNDRLIRDVFDYPHIVVANVIK